MRKESSLAAQGCQLNSLPTNDYEMYGRPVMSAYFQGAEPFNVR